MIPIRHYSIVVGLLAAGASAQAITPLSQGHVDVGIGYEDGAFDLHVHDEQTDTEYVPADALLVVSSLALQISPGGDYSFLGRAGSRAWVLPATENPELLFLGIGAEELVPGEWTGDIEFSLKSVSGPGSFALWDTDPFGRPVVRMDSIDGIGPEDRTAVIPGGHSHRNWGFSAVGNYTLTFEASGVNLVDGPQVSGPVAYSFQVVPEPGTWVLGALGLVALALGLQNRKP